jgi:hypothetical protein
MKRSFFLSAVLLSGFFAFSQPSHPNSPHDTVSTDHIKVTYGRPFKKGRNVFGDLEKFGKVYRCGADEATTISFDKDGSFAGKPVKAGTYTLFVIPNEDKWTIILNSQLKQWGAFSYEKYKDKDVLHGDVPVKKLDAVVEELTIRFSGGHMIVEWDKTQVQIPAKFS